MVVEMFANREAKEENDFLVLCGFWERKDELQEKIINPESSEEVIDHCKTILRGIEKTLIQLPEEQREIIRLHFEEGLDPASIADEIFTTTNRVRKLHRIAMKTFGENIGFI